MRWMILALLLSACGPKRVLKPKAANWVASPASQYITKPSGLMINDLILGTGQEALRGSTPVLHYTGWLKDGGDVFDSSLVRGQPFRFELGAARVIPGWEEGVAGMRVGGVRQLVIPPDQAYGSADRGAIPPNSTLVFEIELLGVE